MVFAASFWVLIFNLIDCTPLRKWAVLQSAVFCISYNLEYPVILFISLFLENTKGFHNYWFCGSFNEPNLFNFYFQVSFYFWG